METPTSERKLAAILMADVVGYSLLMGQDEEATVSTLRSYREVFTEYILKFKGRVVDAKGDALMAEFAAVTEAVACSVEIQRELAERNAELPSERRMDFRIGINLGEVLVEGDEIYGDGVNVAARLETLAEPGGICISGSAYEQVKNRLPLEFDFLGKKEVKNIADPVPAFRVVFEGAAAPPSAANDTRGFQLSWKFGLAAAVVAALAAGLIAWYLFPGLPPTETA
ncbi:MAG: adenylate/guanylate cyclase domain-containing protein, partial [bacterium]